LDKITALADNSVNSQRQLLEIQSACLLRLSVLARESENLQGAINAVTALQHLDSPGLHDSIQDELSMVLWEQGEHALAVQCAEVWLVKRDDHKAGSGPSKPALRGRIVSRFHPKRSVC
jgi:hypothetical protein